jgi:hypothetical protein
MGGMAWCFAAEGGWQTFEFGAFEALFLLLLVAAVITGVVLIARSIRRDDD